MRTKFSRENGKIEIFTGVYVLVLLAVILVAQIQIRLFMTVSSYVEDALAASNLASAIIDVEEYGKTHIIRITSPDMAYELYRDALKHNLGLDENWENSNKDLISGRVKVLKYEIYNVNKQDIIVYSFGEEGDSVREIPGGLGKVVTPDGVVVESTSIYSKIGFPVKGIWGIEIAAQKHKTVDIVSENTESQVLN